MDLEKEQRGTVLRCKESELMIYTLNNRLMTTLTVPANEILLDNIMRVMSGEYFGVRKAAKIVGGRRKLERLIEAGKIEFAKPVNSQNGKWYCRADQVLAHCRNMRPNTKSQTKLYLSYDKQGKVQQNS